MKLIPLLLLLCCFTLSLKAQQLTDDPEQALFVTEDIDRFWVAFTAEGGAPSPGLLKKSYLKPGTQGVKDFTPMRIENHKKLAATVRKEQAYYLAVRPYTLRIKEMEGEIRAHYRAFKALYPATVYPEAYFVIGRINSGGTTGPKSLIMGAEMFGDTKASPAAKIAFRDLPGTVIHELVHYQQVYGGSNGLLQQVLKEGAADFIAAVVMKQDLTQHHLDGYAKPRAKEIWQKFATHKDELGWKSYRGWMYGSSENLFPDAPNDLGYWLGFQICRAYYEQAKDKKQAVYDILNIADPAAFLEKSGYKGQ